MRSHIASNSIGCSSKRCFSMLCVESCLSRVTSKIEVPCTLTNRPLYILSIRVVFFDSPTKPASHRVSRFSKKDRHMGLFGLQLRRCFWYLDKVFSTLHVFQMALRLELTDTDTGRSAFRLRSYFKLMPVIVRRTHGTRR